MPDTTQAVELPIADLRTDGGTQPRAYLDGPTVMEYADAMERGVQLPPVQVMYDGEDYWLYDGFHRVKAAQNIDRTTIRAEVEQGTQEDAQWASLAANKDHGLRRSQADKRRAIRQALKGWGEEKPDREIANHVGVSRRTVWKHAQELSASCENYTRQDKRKVTRNGTTYTQDTTNIGRSKKRKQQAPSTSNGTQQSTSDPEPMQTRSGSRQRRRDRRREEADNAFDPTKQQREAPPADPVPTSEDVAQRIREELVKLPGSQAVSMLRDFVDEQHQFTAEERESVREAAERIGWLILEVSEEIDGDAD